jgi:hypothetical protein
MATDPRRDTPSAATEVPAQDWPAQAADTIVKVVDDIRSKSTEKAVVAARAVVFGLVIGALAVVAGVLLLVGSLRALQVGISWAVERGGGNLSHTRAVWISYLSMGVVLLGLGGFLWKKANKRAVSRPAEERT